MHIILPHSGGAYVVISWYRFEQRYVTSWSMHLFWIFIFVFIVWHYVGVSDIFHVLSYLVWFVVSHKQTVGIWRWRRADSCDVYGGIPGDSTEVPFLFTVKDTMTSLYGAPCAVRLWIFVVCLLSPLLWGYQAWRIFRYVEGLFDFDGMHYPIGEEASWIEPQLFVDLVRHESFVMTALRQQAHLVSFTLSSFLVSIPMAAKSLSYVNKYFSRR